MTALTWAFGRPVDCISRLDEVHVWCGHLAPLSQRRDAFAQILSNEEKYTASLLLRDSDRLMSVCSKGMLRTILGAYLNKHPNNINFNSGSCGKPTLESKPELSFNLTHSGEVIMIAISGHSNSIGIDLEFRREIKEWRSLAARYFHPEEVAELLCMPNEKGHAAFFDCWTRKEAIAKALGLGLSLPLDSFRVTVGCHLDVQLLDGSRLPQQNQPWFISSLDFSSSYAATLALIGTRPLTVRQWQFDPTGILWQALQVD
jgi:4'-phosphopantetheinyl transferase